MCWSRLPPALRPPTLSASSSIRRPAKPRATPPTTATRALASISPCLAPALTNSSRRTPAFSSSRRLPWTRTIPITSSSPTWITRSSTRATQASAFSTPSMAAAPGSFAAATFLGTQPGLTSPNPADVVDGFTSNNGIFVVSGDFVTNGANTTLNLNAPTAVTENLYTGTPVFFDTLPEFAVDTSSAASNGNLYVTWTRFYPKGLFPGDPKSTDGSDNMIAVSTNHGASWTTEMQNGVTVIRDPGDGTN